MSRDTSPLASAPESGLEQKAPVSRLHDQVRERLREELHRKGWSTRDVADLLEWSQSRVAKLLAGSVKFSLDDLEAFCGILHLRPTEVVRDRGMEFCREMTPSDLRLFDTLERDPERKQAILVLLNQAPRTARTPTTKPAKAKLGPVASPKG